MDALLQKLCGITQECVRHNGGHIPIVSRLLTVAHPEQRLFDESGAGRWIYRSRSRFEDGKIHLLRVERRMKVVYDPEVDVLSVLLSDEAIAESDQDKPGVILDYDAVGNMVSFEILDASKRMANPMSVEYAITPPLRRPA